MSHSFRVIKNNIESKQALKEWIEFLKSGRLLQEEEKNVLNDCRLGVLVDDSDEEEKE